MKACLACGLANVPHELFCVACGTSLALIPESDADSQDPGASRPAPAADPQLFMSAFELLLPWGDVPLGPVTGIGRDPAFSPLALKILELNLDTVSRRHAELVALDGAVDVRHLSEMNPTYVNGRMLTPGAVVRVTEDADLAFSLGLRARLRRVR